MAFWRPASDGVSRAACLAQALGVLASAVQLRSGATSRKKTLHVPGDPTLLAARLGAL